MDKKTSIISDKEGILLNEKPITANPVNTNTISLITVDWSSTEIFNSGWMTKSYKEL